MFYLHLLTAVIERAMKMKWLQKKMNLMMASLLIFVGQVLLSTGKSIKKKYDGPRTSEPNQE